MSSKLSRSHPHLTYLSLRKPGAIDLLTDQKLTHFAFKELRYLRSLTRVDLEHATALTLAGRLSIGNALLGPKYGWYALPICSLSPLLHRRACSPVPELPSDQGPPATSGWYTAQWCKHDWQPTSYISSTNHNAILTTPVFTLMPDPHSIPRSCCAARSCASRVVATPSSWCWPSCQGCST
jgi:hypothetical protein